MYASEYHNIVSAHCGVYVMKLVRGWGAGHPGPPLTAMPKISHFYRYNKYTHFVVFVLIIFMDSCHSDVILK